MSVTAMDRRNYSSKRKPLSNLTNTNTNTNTPIPNSNSKSKPKPKPKFKSDTASTGSNTIPNPINHQSRPPIQTLKLLRSSPRNLPRHVPANPKLTPTLADSGSVNYETRKQPASRTKDKEVEIGIEPVRIKDKGKAVVVESFSCPPIERTRRFWDDIEDEGSDINENYVNLSKTCTDGGPQRKKKRNSMPPALPREFVEEQKKYFAEIDAFELEEEVVSESELE